jgi:type II secretory pathway pseudopilin PulG
MRGARGGPASPTPWHRIKARHDERSRGGRHGEEGFTLIELIVVCLILPIVAGALVLVLMSAFSLQNNLTNQISDSADAQIVSNIFEKDVGSADLVTTNSLSSPQCGSGTQLLGLEWNLNQSTSTYETVVSYDTVTTGSGSNENLVRMSCTSGASVTPTSSSVVSYDIPLSQGSPTVSCAATASSECAGTPPLYSTSWVSSQGITGITFNITEPGSHYAYSLVGLPGASEPASAQSTISAPTTQCGFATPGTGTYASTLCFVDFSSWQTQVTKGTGTPCKTTAGAGLVVSAGITNTPYIMSFCLTVGGGPIKAAGIPTYVAPPTSEAFLGNNGFYTGIPGDPAIYQTNSGTTSQITINNIQVLDANGNQATGWQLVTGDAESTDPTESLTWTANAPLTLLPNTSTSPYGNACAEPTAQNPAAVYLTGLGTDTVECAASVSSDKTGTVMLESPTPSSLSVQLVGQGLQAIFVGMMLS